MGELTLVIGPDEMRGLEALTKLGPDLGGGPDLETAAHLAMRRGLAAALQAAGLTWAPSAEVVEPRAHDRDRWSEPGVRPPDGVHPLDRLLSTFEDRRVRLVVFPALGVATLVLLLGGYVGKWGWTGFDENGQVWDWLHLVLLPIAFGTIPLWLRFSEHMSQRRKLVLAGTLLAFIGFAIAGYLVPISWTGFSGHTLWDWLSLIVLPVTLISVGAWPSSARQLRSTHVAVFGAIGIAWVVTLVGGYASQWRWTGYQGNTLWDWLSLLLAPLVISTVLVPLAVRFVSGDVARRAKRAVASRPARPAEPERASVRAHH